mmetsp:Transcript_24884/g.38030  ORF Transcript_24884/g.38030 Transcript_24884/m.38030 type:complete len:101 (-) Transcript_24884:2382-2684(-)
MAMLDTAAMTFPLSFRIIAASNATVPTFVHREVGKKDDDKIYATSSSFARHVLNPVEIVAKMIHRIDFRYGMGSLKDVLGSQKRQVGRRIGVQGIIARGW